MCYIYMYRVMEYLMANASFVASSTVLELGAGTGITGMLCKKLGCDEIYLTDHDQISLDHMVLDSARNDISTHVLPLDWYQYDHDATLRLLQPTSTCPSTPSTSATATAPAPLRIVAGDILYKSVLIDPFFNVITSLLTSCVGSEMLLCHVPRAGVEQEQVVAACVEHDLLVTVVAMEEWKKGIVIEYSIPDDFDRAQLYLVTKK